MKAAQKNYAGAVMSRRNSGLIVRSFDKTSKRET